MLVDESRLESWSNQGGTQASIKTHEAIREALLSSDRFKNIRYEIFLQGSYKNHTNIRGDSDVDIVVKSEEAFYCNLSEQEKRILNIQPARYGFYAFRSDVLDILKNRFGGLVEEGNKAVQIAFDRSSGYVPADVVVSIDYFHYKDLRVIFKGIGFVTQKEI